jgi:hypothetical protein
MLEACGRFVRVQHVQGEYQLTCPSLGISATGETWLRALEELEQRVANLITADFGDYVEEAGEEGTATWASRFARELNAAYERRRDELDRMAAQQSALSGTSAESDSSRERKPATQQETLAETGRRLMSALSAPFRFAPRRAAAVGMLGQSGAIMYRTQRLPKDLDRFFDSEHYQARVRVVGGPPASTTLDLWVPKLAGKEPIVIEARARPGVPSDAEAEGSVVSAVEWATAELTPFRWTEVGSFPLGQPETVDWEVAFVVRSPGEPAPEGAGPAPKVAGDERNG